MSITSIVTQGYGPGASVSAIITQGYTPEVVISVPARAYDSERRPRIDLQLTAPLPIGTPLADYLFPGSPQVAASFTTQLNGGFGRLNFGVDDYDSRLPPSMRENPVLTEPVATMPMAHTVLLIDGVVAFEGRLGTDYDLDGVMDSGKAFGYGPEATRDGFSRKSMGGDDMPASVLMRRVLAEAEVATLLRMDSGDGWVAPDTAYSGREAWMTHPWNLLEMLSEGAPVAWVVYEDQVLQLISTEPPDLPKYHVKSGVRRERSYLEMYTHVAIDVGSDDRPIIRELSSKRLTPADIGIKRSMPLSSSSESVTARFQTAKKWLEGHDRPLIGSTITRVDWRGLELYGGGVGPPWMVRAGEWVQVATGDLHQITHTAFDAWRGSLEVTLGPPLPDTMRRATETAAQTAAAVRDGRDPRTRARARR